MNIENITSEGIGLDRNGQSMLREVYEKEINKLQSNWNSLREYLMGTKITVYNINDKVGIMRSDVLDIMNELEEGDNK